MSPSHDQPLESRTPLPAGSTPSPSTSAALAAESPTPALQWGSSTLRADGAPTAAWVWQGYLAPGCVTRLSGRWTSGKTTLAAVLLAKLKAGGVLAGLPVAAGRAVLVSTEASWRWRRRHDQLHFGEQVGWLFQPFGGDRPTSAQWPAFVESLIAEHARHPYLLLVLDPVEDFLAGSANDPDAVGRFLAPLQRLSARGVAVWLLDDLLPEPPSSTGPRGASALAAAADMVMELTAYPGAAAFDRRRCLVASSRFPETPRQLVIAWTEDGTDYQSLGPCVAEVFGGGWRVLRDLLTAAPAPLTRQEIRRRWPGEKPVHRYTLRRWLEEAAARGLLVKEGLGTRRWPFRYGLPERATAWRSDSPARW